MFQLFKKYYGQYCNILAAKLPTMPATGARSACAIAFASSTCLAFFFFPRNADVLTPIGPLKLAEKDERTVCLIINTAEVRRPPLCGGPSYACSYLSAQWCGVTTVSLTDRIRDRIDSKWKERSVAMAAIIHSDIRSAST